MSEQNKTIAELQVQLATWEKKIDELVDASRRGTKAVRETYGQHVQDLQERLESARAKIAETSSASGRRLDESRRECARQMAELQDAWDATLRSVAWDESLLSG